MSHWTCERCDGTGTVVVYDDPGVSESECGLPSVKLEFHEECPDCVGRGRCPQCGERLDPDTGACPYIEHCGWEPED